MTITVPSLDQSRNLLVEEVLERGPRLPDFDPLDIHPWLAMSLMQKTIRRGRVDLALRASATLLRDSPERFWRRIQVTAYEDIGLADLDTVGVVTSSLKGKRWRSHIGGEWSVASYLVDRMANTIKCRAADDLAVVCQWHPSLENERRDYFRRSIPELIDVVGSDAPLTKRALALWFAIGTNRCRSPVLPGRKGDTQAAFDALVNQCSPILSTEIVWEAFKKSNSILCPFVVLLLAYADQSEPRIEPDNMPAEYLFGEVPGWAYDVHVREGLQALSAFLKTDTKTTQWIRMNVPKRDQFRVLGSMLFRIESGLVDRRLIWSGGDHLRRLADWETGGVSSDIMQDGLDYFRGDLPQLIRLRRRIIV